MCFLVHLYLSHLFLVCLLWGSLVALMSAPYIYLIWLGSFVIPVDNFLFKSLGLLLRWHNRQTFSGSHILLLDLFIHLLCLLPLHSSPLVPLFTWQSFLVACVHWLRQQRHIWGICCPSWMVLFSVVVLLLHWKRLLGQQLALMWISQGAKETNLCHICLHTWLISPNRSDMQTLSLSGHANCTQGCWGIVKWRLERADSQFAWGEVCGFKPFFKIQDH